MKKENNNKNDSDYFRYYTLMSIPSDSNSIMYFFLSYTGNSNNCSGLLQASQLEAYPEHDSCIKSLRGSLYWRQSNRLHQTQGKMKCARLPFTCFGESRVFSLALEGGSIWFSCVQIESPSSFQE